MITRSRGQWPSDGRCRRLSDPSHATQLPFFLRIVVRDDPPSSLPVRRMFTRESQAG